MMTDEQMPRVRRAVEQYRSAPFRSADWLAAELMTICDFAPANDTEHPMTQTNPEVSVVPTQIVPVEPTEAMYEAGYDATRLPDGMPQFADAGFCLAHAGVIYRAMLEAARLAHQTPPATQPIATVGEGMAKAIRALDRLLTDHEGSDETSEGQQVDQDARDALGFLLATLHTPPPVATATVVDAGEVTLREAARDLLEARERLGYAVHDRIDLWSCLSAIVKDAA